MIEGVQIDECFKQFIAENNLPKVEFHSLRHLSATMKLIISKGDIKSVQGDTGHSQAWMVTDTYAHILDQNRKKTAMKFEHAFYGEDDGETDELLEKLAALCSKIPKMADKLRNILASPAPEKAD